MKQRLKLLFKKLVAFVRKTFSKTIKLIDEQSWHEATCRYQFMHGLSLEENRRLRLIASDFLSRKEISGAADFIISETIKIEIAAQASILVLQLGVKSYRDWSNIIVYPSQFRPRREVIDQFGVVHITNDVLAGEAWQGGPVVLSYEDVSRASDPAGAVNTVAHAGSNVVIHEFAHKLDMQSGQANGCPPLHKGMSAARWKQIFQAAYLNFCQTIDAVHTRPVTYNDAALAIDPYAAENPAEFFAVMSEAFFESPQLVNAAYPDVYGQLKLFYRQDPLARATNHSK